MHAILREHRRATFLVVISWQAWCPGMCYICEPQSLGQNTLPVKPVFLTVSDLVRILTLPFHVGSRVLGAHLPHFQDKNMREQELYNSALNITCHKQHTVLNIQNETSLSHSRRPFWQKPSHSCQEYRVQLRTNFKMNLKSICHQIFMLLPDYLWHFNYKHPRRGVLQILTLGSYNKLYWQPLSACRTRLE